MKTRTVRGDGGRVASLTRRIRDILAVTLLIGGSASLSAQGAQVNTWMVHNKQEKSNWCWVATSKTIAQHFGGVASAKSQCEFYKWGKQSSVCGNETGSFYDDVYRAIVRSGKKDPGVVLAAPLSMRNIGAEINRNAVDAVRWQWSGSSAGHMVVIAGYDASANRVYYMDPARDVQWSSLSYNAFKGGSGMDRTWTHTRWQIPYAN